MSSQVVSLALIREHWPDVWTWQISLAELAPPNWTKSRTFSLTFRLDR